jgi:hypothetical protein
MAETLATVADALDKLDIMAEQLQRLLEQRRLEHERAAVVDLPPLPRRVN